MNDEHLKLQVKSFWNKQACGTQASDKEKFSKEYFEDIEKTRYEIQPEIKPFAKFEEGKRKKVLEVGVGAGTDFLQWARAGAKVYGVDVTEEAIEHVKRRLKLFGHKAKKLLVADAERLPFKNDFFDIVYSWGVIHHTPDTDRAMHEIVRVCKPGGVCRVMVYHRDSALARMFWAKHALLKGKPWKSVSRVLFEKMESVGTKAYTEQEILEMMDGAPIKNLKIKPVLTYYDKLGRFGATAQTLAKLITSAAGGDKAGWFLTIEFEKTR